MKRIPFLLTSLRLLLAPATVLVIHTIQSRSLLLAFLVIGFLSDIFDGIVARRLDVSTPALRRYDSGVDIVFYAAVVWAAWKIHPDVIRVHILWVVILVGLELSTHLVSFIKYRRFAATHSYGAKAWGIMLFITFVCLLGFNLSRYLFGGTILLGCLVDLEILAILLISSAPPVDIPTFFHAWKLQQARQRND